LRHNISFLSVCLIFRLHLFPGKSLHISCHGVRYFSESLNELFETRIIPEQIERRIEPKQGRGERDIQSQWVRNRERLTVTFATATISKFVQLLELLADYTARRDLN
jgi:hypothetical protein